MSHILAPFADQARAEGKFLRVPAIMQNAVVIGIVVQTMACLYLRMQAFLFADYDFPFMIQSIRQHSLNALFMVPAIWNRIAQECTKEDLADIRFAMCGASPLPTSVQENVQKKLHDGVILRVNWGMTETTCGATQVGLTEAAHEGSVGRLLPHVEAFLLGPNGEHLGFEQPGELCVKGGCLVRAKGCVAKALQVQMSSVGTTATLRQQRLHLQQMDGFERATSREFPEMESSSLSVDQRYASECSRMKPLL